MTSSQPRVLYVGHRLGALKAAREMGVDTVVMDGRPRAAAGSNGARCERVDLGGAPEDAAARVLAALGSERVDAVLAVTEGTVRIGAHVRAALGLAGTSVDTANLCTDKLPMKRAVIAARVACTDFRELSERTEPAALATELGLPVVVKQACSSGSRGLVVARDLESLRAAALPGRLAERFVSGREMSVESFVEEGRVVFANPTEYLLPLHANIAPAELDSATLESVLELNERAIGALGLVRGMAHLELFLTENGPLFGELAARPPGGRIMPLLRRAWGFDPWRALLALELGRPVSWPARPLTVQGVWILHPGPGDVRSIEGLEAARAVRGVRRVHLRVVPGDRIDARIGSGQHVGYIEAEGATRDEVAAALERAHAALEIVLAP